MNLTKEKLYTLIEEVMKESDDESFNIGKLEKPLPGIEEPEPVNLGGPDWNKGLSDGTRTAVRLLRKSEKQTAKGLLKYIDVATEHRTASYKAGYRLGFELQFSAVLGKPPSKGQLPYANTRQAPSGLFSSQRWRKSRK